MKKIIFVLTTALLILLMLFSVHSQVVFADEGTQTADENPPVDETPPPEEDAIETDADNASEQNDSTDQSGDEGSLPPEESAGEESETGNLPEVGEELKSTVINEQNEMPTDEETIDASTLTVAEVLEQAPEGTDVVVLNESGEVEPLVSQEAVAIIQNGDPMWCPGNPGDTLPGDGSCSSSYTSFDTLLVDLGNFAGDGTIYVAFDYNSGLEPDDISIDGNTYTNLGALIIQGGWDGNLGSANIIGTSTFAGISLEIINWGNNVTVNNVILNSTDAGLVIGTSGAVSLNNVQVTNTTSNNGIGIQNGGAVTINNVDASSNIENGLSITTTNGNIDISNSTFNNNGGLDTLTNTAYGMGVNAETQNGNIDISNITATGNAEGGSYFGAPGNITLANSVFDNNIFFTTTLSGNVFGGYGLEVNAGNNLILNNVSADGNNLFGGDLTAGSTLLITDSTFSNNDAFTSNSIAEGFGLDATANGSITLSNVVANNNYLYGVDITSTTGTLGIQTSNFSFNQTDSGLYATSSGMMTLNMVTASNNGGTGAVLDNTSHVSVTNSFFNSNAGSPYAGGVEITSTGVVTLSTVTANSNQDDGVSVSTSPSVYLNNVTADNNGWDGVYVDGQCTTVHVTDGVFTNNGFVNPQGGYGLEVDNSQIKLNGTPVFSNNFLGNIGEHLNPCFINIINTQPPKDDTSVIVGTTTLVANGQLVDLLCDVPIITLATPKDTHVTFMNLCGYQAFIFDEGRDDITSQYPFSGNTLQLGVSIILLKDNSEIQTLPEISSIVISFRISEDELDQEYAIQYWDGSNWIELEGVKKVFDRVEATYDKVGTFILVRKE